LPIAAAAVARDDADLRVTRQPGLDRAGLAIGEKVDDASPFEIANDTPVTLASLPGPIVGRTRPDCRPHSGHVPAAARHRAVMTMRSGPISTLSINRPAGDND